MLASPTGPVSGAETGGVGFPAATGGRWRSSRASPAAPSRR